MVEELISFLKELIALDLETSGKGWKNIIKVMKIKYLVRNYKIRIF